MKILKKGENRIEYRRQNGVDRVKRVLRGALTAIAAIGLMPCGFPQDLDYTGPSTGVDGALTIPSPFSTGLQNVAMAYDAGNNEIVIFGGIDSSNAVVDTTFTFDGTVWTAEAPANVPAARKGAGMVYDAVCGEIVMFGGNTTASGTSSANLLNDTWVWDGDDWTEKTFGGGATLPVPRWDFSMAYDPVEEKTLLFGGAFGPQITDDTWVWDGTDWTELFPADKPPLIFQHDMIYDGAAGEFVLVGGRSSSTVFDITFVWSWSQNNWFDRTPVASLGPRHMPQMVYDEVRGNLLLFAGGADSSGNTELDDLWNWDGSEGSWTQIHLDLKPTKRRFHNMVFNPSDGLVYLFGGEDGGVEKNDVWTWDGAKWRQQMGSDFLFDVSEKENGAFNFTSIDVGEGVTVTFYRNRDDTPVAWLATDPVSIIGDVDLDGETGENGSSTKIGTGGAGGPGGFAGGRGGLRQDQSGSFAGQAGLGPGGGAPGLTDNQAGGNATHSGSYGNAFILPLVGGSGGGGAASRTTSNGSGAGGGGGAFVIDSSSDIVVNGSINARGGAGSTSGGDGSGGTILLIADRVLGPVPLMRRAEGPVRTGESESRLFSGHLRIPPIRRPSLAFR